MDAYKATGWLNNNVAREKLNFSATNWDYKPFQHLSFRYRLTYIDRYMYMYHFRMSR